METNIFEQAKNIDLFLETLYESSTPLSLAEGIEKKQVPSTHNKEKFKTLEFVIEELGLVTFMQGRNNSTLGGQCIHKITGKGREMVEKNISSIDMLLEREIKSTNFGHPIFDEKEFKKSLDQKVDKRVEQADFFLDIIVSEKLIDLDKPTLRKYFKQWFKESQKFDLQIKNGSFSLEDGSLQFVPDFSKDNIPEFIKWFQSEKDNFISYLDEQGVNLSKKHVESKWSKTGVIAGIVAAIAAIAAVIWQMFFV